MDKHDVFISHASEDKEVIARPLAEFLRKVEVAVWFDEFTLSVGDSLSRSIDDGLISSRFGVVILSPSFFSKGWPKHELSGLVTKEVSYGKTILPIWHNLSADDVRRISPTLADKLALATSSGSVEEIGLKILKVVKPDILAHITRWLKWQSMIANGEPRLVNISSIVPGPILHATLPTSLLIRIRLVHEVLQEVYGSSLENMITNFRRDVQPSRDVEIWERIAASYLYICRRQSLSAPAKRVLFKELLRISFLDPKGVEHLCDAGDWLTLEAVRAWVDVIPSVQSADQRADSPGS